MEQSRCNICQADFRKEVIKNGKCPQCTAEHPDCDTLEEVMAKVPVPNKMDDGLDEAKVRAIFTEMFAKHTPEEPAKRGPGRPRKEDK